MMKVGIFQRSIMPITTNTIIIQKTVLLTPLLEDPHIRKYLLGVASSVVSAFIALCIYCYEFFILTLTKSIGCFCSSIVTLKNCS
uniref:Uncharacterized protein n=1 Tax=Lepeophtheirus salmonis TaxID=72036 RepID=A0A0K2VGJ5_LEPSM